MAAILQGSDLEKLHELCGKNYKDQAIWFLNAFWNSFGQKEAEKVWDYVELCQELDDARKAGSALDELKAHRFLEKLHDTHTVLQLRAQLRKVGAIGEGERPKTVPISHYFVFHYECDWHHLVNASQGDNAEEIARAQREVAEAQEAVQKAVEAAKAAKQAQKELEAALAEVKAQEDARDKKTRELTEKSETGGVVSRNKAKAELAQHLAEDPLPLRKAKITLEAAVKKAEKATKAADAAQENAERRLAEAEAYLKEIASKGGSGQGALWWLDRELKEARKYMPVAKGGIR
jgi:DNA repair exonuclease SbcCD ATPase subunit